MFKNVNQIVQISNTEILIKDPITIFDLVSKMNSNEANETVFNNIRSFVQKEVNNVISNHLEKKNYNVNEAQVWTNQICDDVLAYY